MRVLVTGATGFVGRALVHHLVRRDHEVRAWSRDPARAGRLLGAAVRCFGGDRIHEALDGVEGVVHLAGESIAGGRWTAARRAAIEASRIAGTEWLVSNLRRPPQVLVSASATGYYGDRGDEIVHVGMPPGDDFLARVCQQWETAARGAERLGTRVVTPRLGVVLGRGGALARMLPIARAGLLGRLGSGRQWLPWIHLDDLVERLGEALVDDSVRGPIDAVAPEPVPFVELVDGINHRLRRWRGPPAPAIALRVALGEASTVLLGSTRVVPAIDRKRRFDLLDDALDDLIR